MKKFVKTLILLALLFLMNLFVSGQENQSVLSLLQKKVWVLQGVNGVSITYKYVSNHQVSYVDGKPGRPFEFYLSNSRDTVFYFDEKKGTENGKFIITRMIRDESDERPRPISALEIIEINNNKLVIKTNVLIEYKAE